MCEKTKSESIRIGHLGVNLDLQNDKTRDEYRKLSALSAVTMIRGNLGCGLREAYELFNKNKTNWPEVLRDLLSARLKKPDFSEKGEKLSEKDKLLTELEEILQRENAKAVKGNRPAVHNLIEMRDELKALVKKYSSNI